MVERRNLFGLYWLRASSIHQKEKENKFLESLFSLMIVNNNSFFLFTLFPLVPIRFPGLLLLPKPDTLEMPRVNGSSSQCTIFSLRIQFPLSLISPI